MDSTNLSAKGEKYIGVSLGTEHDVDHLSDTTSYHLVSSAKSCVVIVLHNHPSLSNFSLSDIQFLLRYEAVKMMVVVTNLGSISYLVKNQKYDFVQAVSLFNEAVDINNEADNLKDLQKAGDGAHEVRWTSALRRPKRSVDLEQNPKSRNPHRKEFSGVLTWMCKQSVKPICTSLYFYPTRYYTIENRTFVWYNIYME